MNKNKSRFKAIQHMKNIIKGKRYVVAGSARGFILYDQNDYDKVAEGLGYVATIPVAEFRSFKKASAYLKERTEEENEWSAASVIACGIDMVGGDDWWVQ